MATRAALIVAGLAGGMIALRFEDKDLNWWEATMILLGGTVCAYYFPPIITEYTSFTDRVEPSMGFLIGLISMRVLELFYKLVQLLSSNPKEAIEIITDFLPGSWFKNLRK